MRKSQKLVEQSLREFRTWVANTFGDFDPDTNAELLRLDNEAAIALGEPNA